MTCCEIIRTINPLFNSIEMLNKFSSELQIKIGYIFKTFKLIPEQIESGSLLFTTVLWSIQSLPATQILKLTSIVQPSSFIAYQLLTASE